jgi:TRAP-type mannitol/chloroaromatic compound transport system permease small subunit
MRTIKACLRIIDKTNEWVAKTISWAVILIILSTVYEVVMRYVFARPTIWSFEFNYLAHGIYFMLLGGATLAAGGHVSVDILQNKLSPRARAIVDVCTAPVFFFFIIMMIWLGGEFALNSYGFRETLSSAWAPPVWPVKMVIPIAGGLVLLQGLAKFVRDLHMALTGREI